MNLYTFIMDYNGGIFISQAKADNIESAKLNWFDQLEFNEVTIPENISRDKLRVELQEETLSPLDGCKGVWFFAMDIEDKMAMINIVNTVVE